MPKALVVDDEPNIRELVSVYLTSSGFAVDQTGDGREALTMATGGDYDIIILDIMLPGMDGAEVCRRLRETSSVPVIMLTARDTDLDKVALLESGADDYLTKPFSPPELVARARAVLRRASSPPPVVGRMNVGGLTLDPATREIAVDEVPIELTAKEFDLLEIMMRDAGVVFTASDFLRRPGLQRLRRRARYRRPHQTHPGKLGDAAGDPRFVETVRGVGYRVRKDAT